MDMAKGGRTANGGSCRLTLTDDDVAGRRLFMQWCEEAGCRVYTDEVGHIFARLAGPDPNLPQAFCSSHRAPPPLGGRFGGVYGVLAGRRLDVMGKWVSVCVELGGSLCIKKK